MQHLEGSGTPVLYIGRTVKIAAGSAVVFCLYCAIEGWPTGLRNELS